MKRIIPLLIISALFLGIVSCDDELGNEDNFEPTDYTVKGKVEKGPFISGSTINLQPMNAKMVPTGSTFSTTIVDNAGNFAFNTATLETPYAQLTANGYFFNEVTGRLSIGTLSLRAIADLSEQSTVNVNILTHLKYARILNLVEKGNKTYKEANKQAQEELLSAFGLQKYADTDVSNYSITAGTPEAGALIAISSLILSTRGEAKTTEYLANLSKEFGDNGDFSDETKETIKKDRNTIMPGLRGIEENIKNRYKELGQTVAVMPLEFFFDWNDDGVAGNEIYDSLNPPTFSKTIIDVPKEGGEYSITITSDIPLFLKQNDIGGSLYNDGPLNDIVLENFWTDMYDPYDYGPGSIEDTIIGNTLRLKVTETKTRITKTTEIPIYDIVGNKVATITVTQEGNPELPRPRMGGDPQSVMLGGFSTLSYAMKDMANYVNAYSTLDESPLQAPLYATNYRVLDLWSRFYHAINYSNTVNYFDNKMEAAFGPYCTIFSSIIYYNIVTLWGDAPYVTKPSISDEDNDNFYIARTEEDALLDSLQQNLEFILPELEDKKNPYDTDPIYCTKDVARMLLADIHMYRNDYDKAKPYLTEIVNTEHYSLAPDSNIIMGYWMEIQTRAYNYYYIPLFTYSDVLLSLAECEHHLNNDNAAWENARIVAENYNTFATETAPDGILQYISAVRRISMPEVIGRFSFLKRTGLAKSELGFEDYQLLLPIPSNEIQKNPNLTQNPGY